MKTQTLKLSLITALLSLGVVVNCFGATTYTYIGANNGSWTTTSNWSGGTHYPGFTTGDAAIIATGVNINVSSAPANSLSTITLNNSLTASITISSGITVTLTGAVIVGGGSASNLTITGPGATSMAGLTINYGSTFTIGSLGVTTTTVTLTASTPLAMSNNGNTFTNYGTLNMSSGCTWSATAASHVIANSGTINLVNTTCTWKGNGLVVSNSGNLYLTSGASIAMDGSAESFTNSGNFSMDASSLSSSANQTPFINSGNFTLTNSATLTLTGSAPNSPAVCFNNSGNFNATSSTVNFTSGSANTVKNTGSFIATASPLNFGTGTYTVNNSATFSALSGSNISMPANTSTLNSTAGTFTVTNSNITFGGQTTAGIYNSGTSIFNISGSTVALPQSDIISQTSSGSFTIKGGSVVTLGVSATITSTGNFFAGTSDGTTASICTINLTSKNAAITNSTATGKFYVGPGSIIYMSGDASNLTNTSPGVFTLQSDKTGSAAVGALFSTATTTGTFNVERYFQGSGTKANGRYVYRGYRIISSPVHNSATYPSSGGYQVYGLNYIVGATAGLTTTANSTTNAFITGCTGGSISTGNPSIYLYKESVVPSNTSFTGGNFIGITNITNSSTTGTISTSDGATNPSIPIGNGVLFFDRGQASNWSTRTTSPYIAPEAVTLTSTGLLNTQSVTVRDWNNTGSTNLNYTVTGVGTGSNTNYAKRGFNMVGNPYPCAIDWNTSWAPAAGSGITATNLSATIWVFNTRTNQYDTFTTSALAPTTGTGNATNIIASGQGFFVKAGVVPANPSSLVFNETAKSAPSQVAGNNLLMGTPAKAAVAQTLRLKMVTDSVNYDDIVIGFNQAASAKFSQMEDGQYIAGNGAAEGLSSISEDGIKLAINYMPLPKQASQSIKLFVTAAASGTYTLQRTALDAIPAIYEVWLMDNYTKDSLDIRNNASYAFSIDLNDTTSYGKNRFEVVIRQNPALGVHLLQFTAAKATDGSQVTWKTENEVNYTNFTIERSNDNGVTFNAIGGFVSGALSTYSFLDSFPANGANQYRLRLEDLNGAITYSKVVTLMYSNSSTNIVINNIKLYPNPAVNTINLAITPPTGSATTNLSAMQSLGTTPSLASASTGPLTYGIKIVNITGAVIKTATTASASWQDDVSTLTPGTYIIQVVNNNNKSVVGKSTFVKL